MPAVGNLLRQIGGGDDQLGTTDIVIGDENHFQQTVQRRVAIDHAGDVMNQLDHQLGATIAAGRFAGENLDPWCPGRRRLGAHRLIKRDRLQNIEQLALIFVDPLDVDIEHRIRIDRHIALPVQHVGKADFVAAANRRQLSMQGGVVGTGRQVA